MTFTAEWYGALPELYRSIDDRVRPGRPLLRFMSLLGDQVDPVDAMAAAADAGDLTDPARCPVELLPWLAQLVGVHLPRPCPVPAARVLIGAARNGWSVGSRASIAAAAQTVLTGDRFVTVAPHEGVAGGDPHTIMVGVRTSEVPGGDFATVAAAIEAARVRPAGFVIRVVDFAPTWDSVDSLGATWAEFDQHETFDQLETAAWAADGQP